MLTFFYKKSLCRHNFWVVAMAALCFALQAQTPLPRVSLVVETTHQAPVSSLAFLPKSGLVATASLDNTLKIWHIPTANVLRTGIGLADGTAETLLAPTPDEAYLVSASADGSLRLWRVQTGELVRTIAHVSAENFLSVVVFPQGEQCAVANAEGKITIYNWQTGASVQSFSVPSRLPLRHLVANADGSRLWAADDAGVIWGFETKTFSRVEPLRGHFGRITQLKLVRSRNELLSADENGIILIWDLSKPGLTRQTFIEHHAAIRQVVLDEANNMVHTADAEGTMLHWNLQTGDIRTKNRTDWQRWSGVQPMGNYWVGYFEKDLQIWDTKMERVATKVGELDWIEKNAAMPVAGILRQIQLGERGQQLLTVRGNAVMFWGEGAANALRLPSEPTSVAYNADETQLLVAESSGAVSLWDAQTRQRLQTYPSRHRGAVNVVCFGKSGDYFLTGGEDSTVRLWKTETGDLLQTFRASAPSEVRQLRFLTADTVFISADGWGQLQFWNIHQAQPSRTIHAHATAIHALATHIGSQTVATGGDDGTVKIWRNGHNIGNFSVEQPVRAAMFSADGKQLVVAYDRVLQVWDVRKQSVLHTLSAAHDAPITAAAFATGGHLAASADAKGGLVLWDAQTWKPLAQLYEMPNAEWAVVGTNGMFDASERAMTQMHYVVQNEPIELNQLKERFYEPGLLAIFLQGRLLANQRPFDGLKGDDLYPEPALSLDLKANALEITFDKNAPKAGKVSFFINQKEVVEELRAFKQLTVLPNGYRLNLTDFQKYFIQGEVNQLGIRVFNAAGWLSSRLYQVPYEVQAVLGAMAKDSTRAGLVLPSLVPSIAVPKFYGIFVGTSDYRGTDLDLSFAATDAQAIQKALQSAASQLFGKNQTVTELLTTDDPLATNPPSKANIRHAFENVMSQARADDVVVVYLSGHGVNHGTNGGQFYYLTKDMASDNLADPLVRSEYTISTDELTAWMKQIPAAKQVLMIDACASGRAAELVYGAAKDGLTPGDRRALDRLKDRTGVFVLAGSTDDMASYEALAFGQGLLTYALLLGMNGVALRENAYLDVLPWFQYAADQVPQFATFIGGVQRPTIAAPMGANSFDIGKVTPETAISLAVVKSVFAASNFQDEDAFSDVLGLSDQLDDYLRNLSAEPSSNILFAEVKNHSSAFSVKGRYRQTDAAITVSARLFKGNTPVGSIEIKDGSKDVKTLTAQIIEALQEVLPN